MTRLENQGLEHSNDSDYRGENSNESPSSVPVLTLPLRICVLSALAAFARMKTLELLSVGCSLLSASFYSGGRKYV